MRGICGFVLCLVLTACQQPDQGTQGRVDPVDDKAANGEETPFFVGRWAAEAELCDRAEWELTLTKLSTPGHVICEFDRVRPSEAGYDIDAACTAEGPAAAHVLEITQSAGTLLIEGGPFQPIGLVACG